MATLSSLLAMVGLRDSRSFTFVDGNVNTGTDTITSTNNPLANGYPVTLSNSGGSLPGGLSSVTTYYVVSRTLDTFKLSLTPGGSAVDITTAAGGGTHTVSWGNIAAKTRQTNSDELQVAVTGRASEARNRTHIRRNLFSASALASSTTMYTVTTGKTFYLTGYAIAMNATGAQACTLKLQDGGGTPAATATLIPTTCGTGTAATCNTSGSFPTDPPPFATSVSAVTTGGPIGGVFIIGYEE